MKSETLIEAWTTTQQTLITTRDPDDPDLQYVWTLSGVAAPDNHPYPPTRSTEPNTPQTYYTLSSKETETK